MTATYTKLNNGDWGIRVQGNAKKGDRVTVIKKSGESKTETVGNIVWSGNGVTLCSIARESSRGSSQERKYRNKYGWDGVRGSASYYSSGMYDAES